MVMVKCRNCGKQIDKNLAITISNRRYACSEECKNELEQKELEKSKSNEVKKARAELLDYLKEKSVGKIDFPKEMAYLKKMLKENPDFSISGIKYTLWYLIEIKKKKINGFGLVPYYYEQAKKYYDNLQKARNHIKQIELKPDEEIIIVRTNKYVEEDIFD